MSDTPIFDNMMSEMEFLGKEGVRYFTEDEKPPFDEGRILLENAYGVRIVWNGKRWAEEDQAGVGENFLQNYDCWPPDRWYSRPGHNIWREVKDEAGGQEGSGEGADTVS